jgi:hypothetical protein
MEDKKVEVKRYIRSYNFDYSDTFYGEPGEVSNFGGVTVLCEIDYTTNTLIVYPSICSSNDNFSREIGTNVAIMHKQEGIGFTLPYDKAYSIETNISTAFYSDDGVTWLSVESEAKLKRPLQDFFDGQY